MLSTQTCKCTTSLHMLLLYGYIRPLLPKCIDISLYYSICFAFYRNLLPKFQLYPNWDHKLYLNQCNGNITSSKRAPVASDFDSNGIALYLPSRYVMAASTNPWRKILYNNTNKAFVHQFEMRGIGHNLDFSIGIISKNQLKYNPKTYEMNAYLLKITHCSSSYRRYVYSKPHLEYRFPSFDIGEDWWNSWKSANIEEDWCHTGHKLGIAINCNEWKLYFYCDDKEVICMQLDENEIYYPIVCIYSPTNPCQHSYQIVKYCTDLQIGDNNSYNDYIIIQMPRKSYQVKINMDIDKPETMFENLWKGKMLLDLRQYDGKLENMFALMQDDTFGHSFWRYSDDDFRYKILGNQDIIKLWIIIEMYQHFKHNVYMNLIRKQLFDNLKDVNLVEVVADIITDYTMQNMDEAYSEYFSNERNLENMTVLYCTIAISSGWRNVGLIKINESLIEWMDEYVIPYIPCEYLFGLMGHHFIDYLTGEHIHPDDIIKEDLTECLRMELQAVYERRLDSKYIDRYRLDEYGWSDVDSESDWNLGFDDKRSVRKKKKTKHTEYRMQFKEKYLQDQESEFNSYSYQLLTFS